MKRCPAIYTANELIKCEICSTCFRDGLWIPSRPIGFQGIGFIFRRIKIAWKVFKGEYDALDWEDK